MSSTGGEIVEPNAHTQVITSFELAKINDVLILISGSLDRQLKGWKIAGNKLEGCV